MRFRPCIDIHNGKVKQIVGGSLSDSHASATENFTASQDASYFADLYRKYSLSGGHIILLNPKGTPEYEADRAQAVKALSAWPGGMQIGGGMTPENAADFLDLGASHVIVTSYIFDGPALSPKKLNALCAAAGRD
ncbi:MAG TPA: phosphoribosylformimino-5-aminoimidazole carboxamide ribotide isomerase, partial [Eubacterium sp.]|nr:phosphoribosylformimino-5-aminoimidazole carboxamide ribotide isomerase [Eubacterium sp.]